MEHNWRIETKLIQEGYKPGNGEPRVLPIYQSTTYKYDSTEHVAKPVSYTHLDVYKRQLPRGRLLVIS